MLEPLLERRSLLWANVLPALELIDRLEEVEEAILDPEALLQQLATEKGPVAVQPPTVADARILHYLPMDGDPSEEVAMDDVAALLESGQLRGKTLVWVEGMAQWTKLSECGPALCPSLTSILAVKKAAKKLAKKARRRAQERGSAVQ